MRLSSKGAPPGAGGGPLGAGGMMGGLPGASSLLVRKRVKKIRIPIEEHPNYNFIGLIIGPRGKTQKELEGKTGCKIAIRGRGSVKEGARGRRDGKVMEGDNEPLHVVISGDNQRAVDAASDMVEQMLVVIDDEKNVHKQQQLRELALLNGTLKEEDVFCQICGEKGHRSFECPKRFAANSKGGAAGGMGVKCAICGDSSHPTRDCPQAKAVPGVGGAPGSVAGAENQKQIDSEYLSFMAELDGKKASAAPPAAAGPNGGLPPPPPDGLLPPPPPPNNLPPPPTAPGLPPPPMGGPPQPPNAAPPSNFGGPRGDTGPYGPGNHHQSHGPPPQQHNQSGGAYGGGGHYGNQHYGGGGGYGQQQQQYGQQQHHQYGHQQQQQQQQQPPAASQVKPGEETAGWDPSSYYGSANGGAGGFNWWDQ